MAVDHVEKKLRSAIDQRTKSDMPVSVIAHSFGTYVISKILERDRTLKLDYLIMCGAIVSNGYDWQATKKQVNKRIVNDYGVRDQWPAVAVAVTWGYGDLGTYGAQDVNVDDRDHDLDHHKFFEPEFVNRYWKPLLAKDEFNEPDRGDGDDRFPDTPPHFVLFARSLKYLVLAAVVTVITLVAWPKPAPLTLPDGTGWVFAGYFNQERAEFSKGPYVTGNNDVTFPHLFQINEVVRVVGQPRRVFMVDYQKVRARKKFENPLNIDPENPDHFTGTTVDLGREIEVRDVVVGHTVGNPEYAVWLRIGNP
jgi:hypothetical protein